MARMSAQRDMERKAQDHLTVVLDENLPYGIALTGDWHIGMEGVLYDELDQDHTPRDAVRRLGNGPDDRHRHGRDVAHPRRV